MKAIMLTLLQGAEGAPGAGNFVTTLIPFAVIIGIFYFLIIRPQNKKQKETQKMLAAIKKGDKVVTIGGVHGVIQSVKESSVIVKVDENTKMEFSRSAISSVVTEGKGDKSDKTEEKKAESPEQTGDKSGDTAAAASK
ncbi:MAG: preprotein translocase subunit YajC [Treponema sp.]|jgi:preprotein translocase subunit YajC|nr:preprotein translocase subunit YajC [Treponema sp.]